MDISIIEKFIFIGKNKVYVSNQLEPILKITHGMLIGVYAVIKGECKEGNRLFGIDYDCDGAPIIMWSRPYVYYDSFINRYKNKIIEI